MLSFFPPLPGSVETQFFFEKVLLQAELLKAALGDGSSVTGMNYSFTNFILREPLFFSLELFWVLILTQPYLTKIKKERKPINIWFS
jgi:hypothetical protein